MRTTIFTQLQGLDAGDVLRAADSSQPPLSRNERGNLTFNRSQQTGLPAPRSRGTSEEADLPEFSDEPRVEPSGRVTVEEIAAHLNIGRLAVYALLERRIIPAVRVGRRWIITRRAYLHWERTCGMASPAGLSAQPEVTVFN
jgi:excisionase family DNA binding protein